MEPTSIGAAISVLTRVINASISYSQDVSKAPKECRTLLKEMEVLNSLLHKLAGSAQLPLSSVWDSIGEINSIITSDGKASEILKCAVWTWKKDEVNHLLNRIKRTMSTISTILAHHNLHHVKEVRGRVEELGDVINHKDKQDLADWMSPEDPGVAHASISSKRSGGTCDWFVERMEFTEWVVGGIDNNDSSRVLYCAGRAGTGKTFLVSRIIDHLDKVQLSDSVGMAFVYCDYSSKVKQNQEYFIRLIMKQLLLSKLEFPKAALDSVRTFRHSTRRDPKKWLDTLQTIAKCFRRLFVVVDALDECQDKEGRSLELDFTKILQSLQLVQLNVLVTSRSKEPSVPYFSHARKFEIISDENDIHSFIDANLNRLHSQIQSSIEARDKIKTRIQKLARNNFLLARLYFNLLLDIRTIRELNTALEDLARSNTEDVLNGAYEKTLLRIQSQSIPDVVRAQKIISYVLYCPLYIRPRLLDILAIEVDAEAGSQSKLRDDNILLYEDALEVCAGLVVESRNGHGVEELQFAHQTVAEYLKIKAFEWLNDGLVEISTKALTWILGDAEDFEGMKSFHSLVLTNPLQEVTTTSCKEELDEWRRLILLVEEDLTGTIIPYLAKWFYWAQPSLGLEKALKSTPKALKSTVFHLVPKDHSSVKMPWNGPIWQAINLGLPSTVKVILCRTKPPPITLPSSTPDARIQNLAHVLRIHYVKGPKSGGELLALLKLACSEDQDPKPGAISPDLRNALSRNHHPRIPGLLIKYGLGTEQERPEWRQNPSFDRVFVFDILEYAIEQNSTDAVRLILRHGGLTKEQLSDTLLGTYSWKGLENASPDTMELFVDDKRTNLPKVAREYIRLHLRRRKSISPSGVSTHGNWMWDSCLEKMRRENFRLYEKALSVERPLRLRNTDYVSILKMWEQDYCDQPANKREAKSIVGVGTEVSRGPVGVIASPISRVYLMGLCLSLTILLLWRYSDLSHYLGHDIL